MIVKTIPLEQIAIGARARREMTNIDSLARSIRERGLLQPIVVRPTETGYALVAGGRRIEAHRLLARTTIEASVAESLTDELEALLAENDENTEREDFTLTEKVEHTERIRAIVEARAAERKRDGQQSGRQAQAAARRGNLEAAPALDFLEPTRPAAVGGNFPPTTPGGRPEPKSRDELGRTVGISGRTLEKARHVVQAAQDPEAPEPVRAAAREAQAVMDRTGKVDPAFKKVREAEIQALTEPVRDQLEASGAAEQIRLERWRAAFQKELAKGFGLIGMYRPEQVAASADDDQIEDLHKLAKSLADYINRVEALRERPAGLSLIVGG